MHLLPRLRTFPHRSRRLLALSVVALVVTAAAPVAAAPAPPAAKAVEKQRAAGERRAELHDELHDLRDEELQLGAQLDAARADEARLAAEVAELDRRLADVTARLEAASAALDAAAARSAEVARRLSAANEVFEEAEASMRSSAVSSYVTGGSTRSVNLLLGASSPREFGTYGVMARAAMKSKRDITDAYRAARDEVARAMAEANAVQSAAASARELVLAEKAELDARRSEHDRLRTEAAAASDRLRTLLQAVEARKAQRQLELAELQALQSAIEAELRSAYARELAARLPGVARQPGDARLATPLPGIRMNSTFGPRVHPIFGDVRMHSGNDFAAPSGTPILAADAGVVLFAGVKGGYGNTVILAHNDGLATLYAHMSVIAVAPGDVVERSSMVGLVGSTGNSTGPHLHFEVRLDGVPVNPAFYL